jgi:amino acid adenylation domain-containing protein
MGTGHRPGAPLPVNRHRPYLLSHLVEHAAERDSTGLGVIGADERLDFAALADRVSRLAGALRSQGVAAGDRVAVHAPKSTETFVAMHAILRAGGIAVPVDPRAPASVLEALDRELTPRAIIAAAPTAGRWPNASVPTIGDSPACDLSWADVEAFDPVGPVDRLGSDPAYIISTSGSTGRPKSIVHTNASALRYAELAADCYGLRPDDRLANVAPFHFDQSTFELYAGPLAGAAALLIPDILLRFPASVSELLERERATTWYSVPTILRQLQQRGALEQRDLSALRWVLFGGEIFAPSALRAVMAALPDARFSNVYGPAEVNQCTYHHLDGPPPDDQSVPIGIAWDDTEVRLVDPRGAVMQGAGRGELLVRTATAMAGYWGRPDLDARAFLSEPADGGLSRRWYRTGDVVERDDDGLMTFVGRVDRQVKIRGVRVELEAVEAALDAIDGVTASAAVFIDDADAALVGIVATSTISDESVVLRALRDVLPPGAVPDRIVLVDALPVTTSGKVDTVRAAELLQTGVNA